MKTFIANLVQENQADATRLLQILRAVQNEYHYVPAEAIELIARLLNMPRIRVTGAVEFYSFLHLQPQGAYELLISDSVTDHMLGKSGIIDKLSEKLQVNVGQVRADGLVSLHNTACTGMCDQGPAGLVNGYALTCLNEPKIDRIAQLIEQRLPLVQWPDHLFHVEDNIRNPGLLLSSRIEPGACLKAAFARGLAATLDEIDQSGLRGRGGAGFNTAMKWRFCRQEGQTERYVVCNADEGEPGTFKDRVLLNSYADQVIEGMTLCAAIVGAKQGFIYLRGEYLHLFEKLQNILQQRRQQGLLGRAILQQNFDFDIEIRLGAGAYICGEESALIESLEGKPGIPRNRPPYPVSEGYLGKPTVVNNVETFAAAAKIAVAGGDWFAACGTQQSKGSKILSISGDCAKPGIYEYAFGTEIRTVLQDCGAADVLGVQIGGPSGSFIAPPEFGRKLGFEDLATGGSFIIFNNSRSIVEIVRNFTHFFADESCGFCTPCRVGTALLKQQLDKLYNGHSSAGDLVELEKLSRLVKATSHCGLGQTAANPVLTTLQRFPEYYQSLLQEISFEPGFDLDAALGAARELTRRDDKGAHLTQTGE